MATEITASITSIDPNSLLTEGFELSDQNIIPNQDIVSSFTPTLDKVELWVYNSNQELIGGDEGFTNYKLVQSPSGNGENDNVSCIHLGSHAECWSLPQRFESSKFVSFE